MRSAGRRVQIRKSEKKQSSEKRKTPELDKSKVVIKYGEYCLERGDTFTSLTNFILRCEGLVEDDGEVSGFMINAKPKNNRSTEAEESQIIFLSSLKSERKLTLVGTRNLSSNEVDQIFAFHNYSQCYVTCS